MEVKEENIDMMSEDNEQEDEEDEVPAEPAGQTEENLDGGERNLVDLLKANG